MLGTSASSTVNCLPMGILLMDHGIFKNHCISGGSSGIAVVTVGTTVCLLGKKQDRNLVTSLLNIMENGHSDVYMEFRSLH